MVILVCSEVFSVAMLTVFISILTPRLFISCSIVGFCTFPIYWGISGLMLGLILRQRLHDVPSSNKAC